ncbi:MAG: EamA family transporter [Pseudomonadales bacterium]
MSAPSPQLATMGPRFAIIGAFAVIYSIWGTTYLAIALSLETLPPFLSGASRFLLAASILGVWLGIRSPGNFRGVPLTRAIVVGVLLTGVGNGLVVYAQQGVPSGIAALFVSAIPGLVLLLDAAFFTRRAPPVVPLTGVCVALAGIRLLSGDLANLSDSVSWRHLVALLIATGWSLGAAAAW